MSTPIRFALVGCGQIAAAHARAIDNVDGAELTWCQDIDAARAAELADRHGSARATTDYAEVLVADDVDVVFLCLPHHLHESFTVQAARAGRHVLVEKPMAMNEAEARRMVTAAAAAGVLLAVGQSTRCMAALRRARDLLAEGAVGAVRHLLHQRVFHIEQVSTDWRRVQGECGGLYLPLFGSHDVDAALWLLSAAAGEAAVPARVWASLRAFSGASAGDSDGVLCLDFADGRLATFQFSVCSRQARTEWLLVGETATLAVGPGRLRLDGAEIAVDLPDNAYADAFAEQVRQMTAAVRGTGPLPAPGDEVQHVVRVLDLARAAAAGGATQDFS